MRSRPPQMPGNVIGHLTRFTSVTGNACGVPLPARSRMPSASSRRLPSAATATGPISALDALVHERRRARVALPPARACCHGRRQVGVRAQRHPGHGVRAGAGGVGHQGRAGKRSPLAGAMGAPVDEQRPVCGHAHRDRLPVTLVMLVDPRQPHRARAGHADAARRGVPVVDEGVEPVLDDDRETGIWHARIGRLQPRGSGALGRVTAHDARVHEPWRVCGRRARRARAQPAAEPQRIGAGQAADTAAADGQQRRRQRSGAHEAAAAVDERRAELQQLVGARRRVALVLRAGRDAGRSARRSGCRSGCPASRRTPAVPRMPPAARRHRR